MTRSDGRCAPVPQEQYTDFSSFPRCGMPIGAILQERYIDRVREMSSFARRGIPFRAILHDRYTDFSLNDSGLLLGRS